MIELCGKAEPRSSGRTVLRCLLIGAGEAGHSMALALRRATDYGLIPIGFLDDNPAKHSVAGLPVLGTLADLEHVAAEQCIDAALITIPTLPARQVRELVQTAMGAGLIVRTLPSFVAALERDLRVSDLRGVRADTLLGRKEVHVVRGKSRTVVEGKRVLVTGAGGSIGSELCRQIKAFNPAMLYMLDHDESNLHRLQLQLTGQGLLDSDDIIIADIRDKARIEQLFQEVRPEVVFHVAAHKHLPLLERHPCEGVKSNVQGTMHLVEAALAVGAERFILISTDKAADPSSVLGATKRLAEMVVQSHVGGRTRFASVRFGNVLGSRGSFLTVLSEQIESGEPITVTHPDVTRFFMTVEEAVGLVIEAAAMAERGETFILDMGKPVRIVDLVRKYASLLHLNPDDITIRYTGLRPGEKLDESLVGHDEEQLATEHPRISKSAGAPIPGDFDEQLDKLFADAAANRMDCVRRGLQELVHGYVPSKGDAVLVAATPYADDY